MSNISIGITAMELFAYNPFRILGIAVDTPRAEIDRTYNDLIKMADTGDISTYKTDFDFDSLPPFSRSAQTIKTAYAKLASNGYRCFAYSDSDFSISLNIDDIALNLRDITSYDCFLRCYMWLIINDREMQEHDLWIQLAKYIDKLILSSPEEWEKYFDHRFPAEMVDASMAVYKSFYSTFCEIILLPIKEMVRGSMKCSTAIEILKCAKIDVDEKFDYIEIPQANVPKPGEPIPKLKLALKDGEEYFDISTGTMKSYSTDTEAAESNSFAAASNAPLEADVLISDEPEVVTEPEEDELPHSEVYEEPEYEAPAVENEPIPQPEPVREVQNIAPQQETAVVQPAEPVSEPKPVAPPPRRPERRIGERKPSAAAEIPERKAPPKPTEPVAPKPEPLKLSKEKEETARPAPRRSLRSMRSQNNETAPAAAEQTSQTEQPTDFNSGNPFFTANKPVSETPKQQPRRSTNGYTKLVKEAEKKEEERAAFVSEGAEDEEDENLYTNALIEMLKSNQSRGETMKSVDTRHAMKNGDKDLTAPAPTAVSMDAINMNKYDDKLLASPYEMAPRKLTREEKYRNIKIDDMLNPGGMGQKNYGSSAIEEYKKNKEKEKQSRRSILALTGVLAICLVVFAAMWLLGIF